LSFHLTALKGYSPLDRQRFLLGGPTCLKQVCLPHKHMHVRVSARNLLTGHYLNALTIDLHREDFYSCVPDAGLHSLAGVRFNQ
jgi:hypothetical protein